MNKTLANLVLIFISLAITLVMVEIILRFVPLPMLDRIRANQNVSQQIDEVHPKGLYVLHPEIGWTLSPGFAGNFKKDDFNIQVKANSKGHRDKDYGIKVAGVHRILGLGDSFAFGWGVENESGFLKQMEEQINTGLSLDRYEIINGGIPGFGTYEALQFLKSIGVGYHPDLVLVAFYEGNDYKNNIEAPRQRIIRDGFLSEVKKENSKLQDFLIKKSVLYAFLHKAFENLSQKRIFRVGLERTKQYLLEMKSVLGDAPLVFVLIPDQDPEFYDRHSMLRKYDRWIMGTDLFSARKELELFCRENGIYFYQLSPKFENNTAYILKDTHLNEEGHEAASLEIIQYLKGEKLLPSI